MLAVTLCLLYFIVSMILDNDICLVEMFRIKFCCLKNVFFQISAQTFHRISCRLSPRVFSYAVEEVKMTVMHFPDLPETTYFYIDSSQCKNLKKTMVDDCDSNHIKWKPGKRSVEFHWYTRLCTFEIVTSDLRRLFAQRMLNRLYHLSQVATGPESTPEGFRVFFAPAPGAGVKNLWKTGSGDPFHFR